MKASWIKKWNSLYIWRYWKIKIYFYEIGRNKRIKKIEQEENVVYGVLLYMEIGIIFNIIQVFHMYAFFSLCSSYIPKQK